MSGSRSSSPTALQSCNPSSEEDAALCADLVCAPRILDRVVAALESAMVVGEERTKRLLYLVLTTRFFEPVSAAVKGPSAGGKSFLVHSVLELFPPDAYYALTAMSEKALAYSQVPLRHRFLVLFEAAGLHGDFASYLIRSLLSERRVRYETVERVGKSLQPKLIEREGPTGLLTTTTAVRLHPENETRMLSIPVADTAEQTAAIMRAAAAERQPLDAAPFHALQRWLGRSVRPVQVPFAGVLAREVPPVAVRLRRDFPAVLTLVRAHAFLHQASRPSNDAGEVCATLDDYAAVRELVADLVAEGVAAAVSTTMRETVGAVAALREEANDTPLTVAAIARRLRLDESAASRRVRAAIDRGYLRNLEEHRRRPARLELAEALPDELVLLPTAERLQDCIAAGSEADAPESAGRAPA